MDSQWVQLETQTLKAVPDYDQNPLPVTALYRSMHKPRMPYGTMLMCLQSLIVQGKVEAIQAGRHLYYRRRHSGTSIALPRVHVYNDWQGKEFPLSKDRDPFLAALYPLRAGKPVLLWMDFPPWGKKASFRGTTKRLVSIVPGPLAGLPQGSLLIAVIGAGSCVMRLSEPRVADLVLARMPASLANELTKKLRQVFKQE